MQRPGGGAIRAVFQLAERGTGSRRLDLLDGHLPRRVLPQGVGIVEVFATVAQAADALAQERLLRMFNQRRIARIGQHLGDGPLSLWMIWVIQLHQRLDCLLAEDKFASAATEIRVAADVSRFILKLERTHVRCCNFALPAADASRRVR